MMVVMVMIKGDVGGGRVRGLEGAERDMSDSKDAILDPHELGERLRDLRGRVAELRGRL